MTEVTSAPQPSMFALDEANSQRSTRSSADQSPDAQHATRTDSRSSSQQQQQPESEGQTSTSAQIDLARRVVPVQDCEDDVCSICLDGFSHDDPAQLTECRCTVQCASLSEYRCHAQACFVMIPAFPSNIVAEGLGDCRGSRALHNISQGSHLRWHCHPVGSCQTFALCSQACIPLAVHHAVGSAFLRVSIMLQASSDEGAHLSSALPLLTHKSVHLQLFVRVPLLPEGMSTSYLVSAESICSRRVHRQLLCKVRFSKAKLLHAYGQEEGLNELLPFGEYRPPEHDTPSGIVMGMDSWEVDQLLARLAMSSGSARRSSRAARHAARAARQAQLGNDSGMCPHFSRTSLLCTSHLGRTSAFCPNVWAAGYFELNSRHHLCALLLYISGKVS